MHGHYPFLNLFEGNIVQNIQLDQTWGPSGPYNTFFRNRVELYGILMTSAAVESNDQHFVGNEVTNPNVLMGNYIIAGTGHIQHGNMVRGTLTPAGTTPLNDSSYYLTSAPSFWGTTGTWPSIGIPNTPGSGTNPAKARYLAGGQLTVCREDFTTGISINENNSQLFSISPNPISDKLNIYSSKPSSKFTTILCHDITGRKVFEKQVLLIPGNNSIQLSETEKIVDGVYILNLMTKDGVETFKLLKQ